MIAIKNTLISDELIEKTFACELALCKGACCVAGDSGAPLEQEELTIFEIIYPFVKPAMIPEGIKAIEKHGFYVIDSDNDLTTPLLQSGKQCAFVYFENDIAKCAIEKIFLKGQINFRKPVSCHLYPVRITKHKEYDAVNYEQWNVCKTAPQCGKKQNILLYRFLKEPLIRKYGEEWYNDLEATAKYIQSKKLCSEQ